MALSALEHHPSLYLLRDHLDAALALGEDLQTADLEMDRPDRPGLRDWIRQTRKLQAFLASVRTLEYALTARLIQACKRADDLRRDDVRLRPFLALFVAGTQPLLDGAAELGDADSRDFDGMDLDLAFLRSRGLLAADAAGLELVSRLAVGDDYQVAGRLPLGTLLDLVATFLDALEQLYDLHGEALDDVALTPRAVTGGTVRRVEPSAAN